MVLESVHNIIGSIVYKLTYIIFQVLQTVTMSLQWTIIAGILYTEVFLCALMLLPFISAYR